MQFIETTAGEEELSEEGEPSEDEDDDSEVLQTENTADASQSFQKLTLDDKPDEGVESSSASQPLPVSSEENTASVPVRTPN